MSRLVLPKALVRAAASTATFRAKQRRFDRPTWTWREQLARDLLRDQMRRIEALDIPSQRRIVETYAAPPLLRRYVASDPADAGGVRARWFVPRSFTSGPVVLYFHGGGYAICSTRTHEELISRIALAARARVLAIDYRLAPEHPFPGAVEDALAAYRWLLSRHIAHDRIALAGDSAGGGLTLATLVALRDAGDPLPAAAALLSPWVDMEAQRPSIQRNAAYDYVRPHHGSGWKRAYLGSTPANHPLASPIHADLTGLPPLLVQVGGAEMLLDDGVALAEKARASGVGVELEVWEDMIHVWQFFGTMIPRAREAIRGIGGFVRKHAGAA